MNQYSFIHWNQNTTNEVIKAEGLEGMEGSQMQSSGYFLAQFCKPETALKAEAYLKSNLCIKNLISLLSKDIYLLSEVRIKESQTHTAQTLHTETHIYTHTQSVTLTIQCQQLSCLPGSTYHLWFLW